MSFSLQSNDLEELMRFDPEEGIQNLDDHLQRLSDASEARGFHFDRHAARNELQAATFGRRRASTARLVLSPTGVMAIEVRDA
jgi:branched-subunit amino acid aminotransferase/4-amino-4-deoxychorismate lyase